MLTCPNSQPTNVVATIPTSIAPRTFQTLSTAIVSRPNSASSAPGALRLPSATKVAGSATMMPAFFSPMKPMNSPIPPATAENRCGGITATISCRAPVNVSSRNAHPEMNTQPSAIGQGTPMCWTTVKLK